MEKERINRLCMKCMHDLESDGICPYCGDDQKINVDPSGLAPGIILENKYLVGEVKYQNSSAIGYIGYDMTNKCSIYICEFMPKKFCIREKDQQIQKISPYDSLFDDYMEKFLCYARSVARFRDVASLVPIYDIFEANNTAYYITDFVRGTKLSEFVRRYNGNLNWETIRSLFMPALSAMSELHKANIMHLGLSPETLIVTHENKLTISRFAINEVRQANAILVPELFEGYAAPEQYIVREKLTESTDVYSFCACILFALSGKNPPASNKRKLDSKLLVSKDVLDNIPQYVVSAIANGLNVSIKDRTQSFEELYEDLSPIKDLVKNNIDDDNVKSSSKDRKISIYWIIVSCMLIAIVALIFGIFNVGKSVSGNNKQTQPNNELTVSEVSKQDDETSDEESYIVTPNLIGVELEDAKAVAEKNGLYKIMVSEKEFSDTVVEGRIMLQVPEAKTKMEKGSTIVVNVSKGAKMRKLPVIKGLSLSAASMKLNMSGLVPKQEEVFSDTVNSGLVIGYKDYNVGDKLEYGSEVTILISKGKEGKTL